MTQYYLTETYYGKINGSVYKIEIRNYGYSFSIDDPTLTKMKKSARKFKSLEIFKEFAENYHRKNSMSW